MTTLYFEEPLLRMQLDRLPREHRAAFAAACAERLFPAYVRFAHDAGRTDAGTLRAALDRLWDDLAGKPLSELELRASAKKCRACVPDENKDPWEDSLPNAQDAGSALVYALEARVKGSQEAVWSARCAYDALDRSVMLDDSGVVVTANEQRLLEHPLVQAELARQRRDLDELLGVQDQDARAVSARLRDRAKSEAGVFFGAAS